MKIKSTLFGGLLAVSALLQATPVTGIANIAGNVTVQDGVIAFSPTFTATTGAMETGAFIGLTGGTIQTLTGGPLTGNLASPVVGFVNFIGGGEAPAHQPALLLRFFSCRAIPL